MRLQLATIIITEVRTEIQYAETCAAATQRCNLSSALYRNFTIQPKDIVTFYFYAPHVLKNITKFSEFLYVHFLHSVREIISNQKLLPKK